MKIIKYKRMTEVNHGTEEEPNIVQVFDVGGIQCTDDNFDTCYTAAQSRAYNGEVTVEEIEEPIPEQITSLKTQLSSTDYKIIKCSEAQLLGEELPYDIASLHAERQALRNKINELEQQLEANEKGGAI